MPKKKKSRTKRPMEESRAALYQEDLGMGGIKRQTVDTTKETADFRIKVNSAEKKRRMDRMVGSLC